LAVVNQVQSLIHTIDNFLTDLPALLDSLSGQEIKLGPIPINLSQFTDLSQIGDQLISMAQTFLGQAGSVVSTVAGGAASTVGWSLFVLVISYFVLSDAGRFPDLLRYVDLPGYASDIQRIGRELGRIWNAFLRGQILMVLMVMIAYTIMLSILGVRYFYAIAILAGLARFVPIVGPWVSGLVTALVTFFQPGNYFHLQPWQYTLMVIILSIVLDQIFDNLVNPRVIGKSLGLHPAAVLVVALIMARLIGLVGLLLAAPLLATIRLMGRYTIRKMLDQEPWPDPEEEMKPIEIPWLARTIRRLKTRWQQRQAPKSDRKL
jgi:predicted PurR-regulated permease PerM